MATLFHDEEEAKAQQKVYMDRKYFSSYDQQIAALDLPIGDADRQGQRDRRGRGVAVILNGHNDAVHPNAQLARGGFDDPDIGLMWHDPVDVIGT